MTKRKLKRVVKRWRGRKGTAHREPAWYHTARLLGDRCLDGDYDACLRYRELLSEHGMRAPVPEHERSREAFRQHTRKARKQHHQLMKEYYGLR